MSTRCSLAYHRADGELEPGGANFHLFTDLDGDKDTVCLELTGNVEFTVDRESMRMAIPFDVWETIRRIALVDFSKADETDDALMARVTAEVDQRIAEYAAEPDKKVRSWTSLGGSVAFGRANEPREDQIKAGYAYFTEERNRVRAIRDRMTKHEVYPR